MDLLTKLFSSKKFVAMLVGLIAVVVLKVFKVEVDKATVGEIVGLVGSYIVGQGISDNGKGAAQVSAIAGIQAGTDTRVNLTTSDKIDAIKSV